MNPNLIHRDEPCPACGAPWRRLAEDKKVFCMTHAKGCPVWEEGNTNG